MKDRMRGRGIDWPPSAMITLAVMYFPASVTRCRTRDFKSDPGFIHLCNGTTFPASWTSCSLDDTNKGSTVDKPLATAVTDIPYLPNSMPNDCTSNPYQGAKTFRVLFSKYSCSSEYVVFMVIGQNIVHIAILKTHLINCHM